MQFPPRWRATRNSYGTVVIAYYAATLRDWILSHGAWSRSSFCSVAARPLRANLGKWRRLYASLESQNTRENSGSAYGFSIRAFIRTPAHVSRNVCVCMLPAFVGPDNALIPVVGRAERGIVTNAFNATLIGPPKRGDTSPPDVFSSRDLITLTFYRVDSFSWSRTTQCRSPTMGCSDRALPNFFSRTIPLIFLTYAYQFLSRLISFPILRRVSPTHHIWIYCANYRHFLNFRVLVKIL